MSCRVATFAEIHSTKDIDICRKFNDIYVLGKGEGLRFNTLPTNTLSFVVPYHRVEEVTKLHGFRFCGCPGSFGLSPD